MSTIYSTTATTAGYAEYEDLLMTRHIDTGCADLQGAADYADAELLSLMEYAAQWDADAASQAAEVAAGWDAFIADLATLVPHEPEPTPPSAARQRAIDKAAFELAGGLEIRQWGAALLVPSRTRGGVIHRVEAGCCSCEASQAGRDCWHVEAVALARPGELVKAA